MPSERVQRQIDRLLDEAEQAIAARDWELVAARCDAALALDAANADALSYLTAARQRLEAQAGSATARAAVPEETAPAPLPNSFAGGRYQVTGMLGEGGRKVVYRAHDTLLDRDVAFAIIKTAGLDEAGRERVKREAQALGRLGSHPNIVTVFELGEEDGQPFIVTELLPGGDLAHLIAEAPDHRLPLPRVLEIATAVSRALAFAHEHGVIHRDLKPGNVWLAQDGTSRLGDFGLAVAGDDPRLTQAGMMVGTALYMAPEQATGGEVTPRSDLYSLGCLLYELVCGRPPFTGDTGIALIGQHLSSTPVAPSWYRPDCPRALEGLVLRLLEKQPSRRPASAEAVAEQLAGIAAGKLQKAKSGEDQQPPTPPSGQSPVYRRTFVGRESELQQLEAAFDAAAGGQGALVMVCGEPGVGKTALTEQLATYTGLRGGRVLVGHCYEEGSLSLPYLPFVEALRGYVLSARADRLREVLGGAASEVARIVSEVRERVGVEPAAASGDPIGDRYRLLQGVSDALHGIAEAQPLVLVLEDLHDADRGTLDLLLFLARGLQGARLLLVGTYRDVEVDRQHPLSATLAELRRGTSFSRLLLRGLSTDEVQRMIAAIAGQDVTRRLAETVQRQTEGNPLFVQEVVRYLADAGLIERKDGRWQATSVETLLTSIPEGLRDVIGKRLSRLSADCNRLLSIAAVIGRDFRLETLVPLSGEAEERVLDLLDEAAKVAVLQVQTRVGQVQYRFAHAFFRQTLYEELSPPRRLRLHQQVARALEQQYAGREAEHAAELAEHYAQSTDPNDLAKAVRYGRAAAGRAATVFAHTEAERLLRQALEVQEVLAPDDRVTCCDLLLQLGDTVLFSGRPREAAEAIGPRAFALAEALADDDRAAASAALVLRGLLGEGAATSLYQPEFTRWTERLDRYARPGTRLRVLADNAAAGVALSRGQFRQSWELLERAVALAKALDAQDLLSWVVGSQLNFPFLVAGYAARLGLVDEYGETPSFVEASSMVGSGMEGNYYLGATTICFDWGQRERAERFWQGWLALLERRRSPGLQTISLMCEVWLATLDGDLEGAIDKAGSMYEVSAEQGSEGFGRLFTVQFQWRPLLHLGRYDALLALAPGGPQPWRRTVCLAHMGRLEEARQSLRASPQVQSVLSGGEDSAIVLSPLLEASVLVGDEEVAAALSERLAPLADLASCYLPESCPGRHLGAAAALLGRPEQARSYYARALAVAEKVRFRPEIALIRLQMAELAAGPLSPNSGGTKAEGPEAERNLDELRAHLEFVIPELEAMGMRPALERALTLRERLGVTGARGASQPVTAPTLPGEPEAPPVRRRQVFISYGSKDLARALALEALLRAQDIPVWLDKRSIPAGSSWDAEIVRGIRNSAVIAVLCSPEAVQSPHVQQELRLAMEYQKPLLPLILRPTAYPDEVKYILTGRQWVELLERPESEWFPQVLAAVQGLTAAGGAERVGRWLVRDTVEAERGQ